MKTLKLNRKLKNFYILQLGQFISQFGSKMTSYGLIIWAYEQSGSVLSTSSLMVCTLLPSTLLSFFAGSFIDGWKKKKILLATNAIATVFSFIIVILLLSNRLHLGYLYLINFALGIVDAFADPAYNVAISLIVPKEYYTKISGYRSLTNAFNTTLSPIVATCLYALLGLRVILIFDLFSFIIAFISLWFFVHVPDKIIKLRDESESESFLSNCKQGIAYIVKRKDIFHLILYMAFVNFIAAIYTCSFTPMILSRSGNNKFQLGIVSSMVGIAGIIGSILVTVMKEPKKRVPVIINTMLFSFLVCNSMLGIGRNFYIWMVAVLVGNCMVPFLVANVEYIMRTKTPLDMHGRVFSARNTLQYFSIPLGYILGGALTDRIILPFMKKPSAAQHIFADIVGSGNGNAHGLIYLILALLGFLGCCYFKFDKHLKALEE